MNTRSDKIKEIGLIAAGIDEEYQGSTISGVIKCAKEVGANVSCFGAFAGVISSTRYDTGEYNIYNLINYRRLDGIILMAHTISDPMEKEKIIRRVKRSKLPTVIFDCGDYPEFFNITTDNYKAMSEIVRHVIKVHKAKTINYISGPVSNPDAEARYEAFINVLAENGIASDSRRTFFGDFRPSDGEKAVREFMQSGLPMPDAIICANDAMALAAMEELQAHGMRVPEDIIVTGFDDIYNSRHTTPSLTTISRHLDNAGYIACKTLIRLIDGMSQEPLPPLDAVPSFRGSCGCCNDSSDLQTDKHRMFTLINSVRRDISLLNRITTELAETETADENFAAAAACLRELKCERFSICLCENWDSAFQNDDTSEPLVKGYTSRMSAPMILTRNGTESVKSFRSSAMHPVPLKGGGNISFFLPLHFRERCLGYYVITGSDFPLKSLLCHTLLMNISNSIENIRKLIHLSSIIKELDRLYVIDPLCGIYNRNGFIRCAGNIFRRCQQTHASVIISFIDMDGLKIINDNYGHDEGDFALRSLASAINECCKGGRICARFGGDEFIILGENASQEDVQLLEAALKKQIAAMNRIMNKPYELSASIGTIVAPIDDDDTLFGLITLADSLMYERKKKKKTSRYLRHD